MSSVKSMVDFLDEASALDAEVIDGELTARSITPQRGPLINKRRQLATALLRESEGQIFVPFFQFEPLQDLRRCAELITVHELTLNRRESNDEQKRKAKINLKFLDARINRIICMSEEEKRTSKELSHNVKRMILGDDMIDLEDSLAGEANASMTEGDRNTSQRQENRETNTHTSTSTPPNAQRAFIPSLNTNQSAFAHNGGNTNPCSNQNPFQHFSEATQSYNFPDFERAMAGLNLQSNNFSSHSNRLPIFKWKLKFSGLNDKQDAFEFLRAVKSKAKSYNTSNEELFASASEFFIGEASKWYFSQIFIDWTDIEEKLIADFMQVNYFDDLIDTIRQRKQTSYENVVQFITIFEDNCSRLRNPLTTREKISILKRNVLPKYQTYIALMAFSSVNELKHSLKLLEATMPQNNNNANRYVRFDSRDRNSRSSDRFSHSPNRFDKYPHSPNHSDRYSHSPNRPDRYSHSPNRSENQFQNRNENTQREHVSRFDDSKNRNFSRTHSPYPNNNNNSNNNNNNRERSNSNSNGNRLRSNSREEFFRQGNRDNSANRLKNN